MLSQSIKRSTEYQRLLAAIGGTARGGTALFGLPAAARAMALCALCEDTRLPMLVVTASEAEATRLAADVQALGIPCAIYPTRDFMFRNIEGQSREYEYRRLDVLGKLVSGRVQLVAAPIEAVLQRTLPKEEFLSGTLTIKPGMNIPQKELISTLFSAGYAKREQIDGPGQFSVRGGIVDIFAPDMPAPARLEYWGDEVDSLHSFELISQRRDAKLQKIYISPAREVLFGDVSTAADFLRDKLATCTPAQKKQLKEIIQADIDALEAGVLPEGLDKYFALRYDTFASVLDYMDDAVVFMDELCAIREEASGVEFRTQQEQASLLEEGVLCPCMMSFYADITELMRRAETCRTIYAESFPRKMDVPALNDSITLTAHALPPWSGSIASLAEEVSPLLSQGYFCAVLAGTPRAAAALAKDLQASGLRAVALKETDDPQPIFGSVAVLSGRLSAGAQLPFAKFALFTSRRQDSTLTQKPKRKKNALASLSDISEGDYVVHHSHGIGLYSGIQRLDMQGVVKDYLKILYDKKDVLYVPVTQLDLLSRYTAPGDGEKVKLARLGGEQWTKTKARVRSATREIAQELVKLYALRTNASGFAFSEDDEWQRDFETRFEHEETPEQLQAAYEIKQDLQRPYPMDRLLSGDVGVGKTEVALRAAFKCIMGGKQCAILVPTTLLALQHYNTILSRMEAFAVKAEMLSRFRTPKQIRDAVKGLADGTVDIVVGTHRLLQKDIKFHDLGLLIIDEEQRFGVRHKEKLKETFIGVDTLTLSATPIPRTLSMALSGIRDMSSIEEPPTERHPVETYVMEYDEGLIYSAIKKELDRDGQVYYLHNRIESIEYTAQKLAKMLPNARIAISHGRMEEQALSRTWQALLNGEIDILVCTTLIETGVDVRNVNTLIIEDADRMGLAQLYQIRGRVGRSGRKAYAYCTFRRDKVLTDVAAKRLSAIREFTAFGSGFRIAMRDLQIRGAGNLLGQSQSGHMEAVGYDLYVKLLNQAVALAKGEELAPDKSESKIDITVDAYIPESYIPSAAGRIQAYKQIAAIQSTQDAQEVLAELCDRYGALTQSVRGLVDISLLRVLCAQLGIYEVSQQKDTLILYSDALKPQDIKQALSDKALRIMFSASSKPYLSCRIAKDKRPLDVLNSVINALISAVEAEKSRVSS